MADNTYQGARPSKNLVKVVALILRDLFFFAYPLRRFPSPRFFARGGGSKGGEDAEMTTQFRGENTSV